ncbi:MAG: LLM class flavin-dependent oxidoreductase [Gammaproteobacteria bacterium]
MTQQAARGVLTVTDALDGPALVGLARRVEALGYDSLWLPELNGREPFTTVAYLLAVTTRLVLGTGVANVYARDAHALAQAAQTLGELSGGRFALGLGVSNVGLNAARGHAWQPPLARMTACLDALGAVTVESPPPASAVPLYLAAHGPRLQQLAAARADGIFTYLMPPSHIAASRARLGPGSFINAVCPCLALAEPAAARAQVRAALAYYFGLDYYHREWRKLGLDEADFGPTPSDRLVDMVVAWGAPAALEARLAEYAEAGADRVLVLPLDAPGENDTLAALAPAS